MEFDEIKRRQNKWTTLGENGQTSPPTQLEENSGGWPESQKPRQRVSNADRKVFANPESFCDKFIIG